MNQLLLLALTALTLLAPARAAEPADAFAQNHRLGRGVNILGYDPLWRSRDLARFRENTHHIARTAEALGWSWAYWQFDSDFLLWDMQRDDWVAEIRDALVPPAKPAGAP